VQEVIIFAQLEHNSANSLAISMGLKLRGVVPQRSSKVAQTEAFAWSFWTTAEAIG
jgi:hypothetical protein